MFHFSDWNVKNIFLFFIFLFFSSVSLADTLIIEPDMGRTPLLSALKKADHSVELVIYGLTDPTLIDALVQSKQDGKKVRVLLEPHPYRNENENVHAARRLNTANIPLQYANTQAFKLTHQKTLLLDQKSAMVMTFNLTRSTFKGERNFALLIQDPTEVNEIQRVFEADWAHRPISVTHPKLVWSPDNSRKKISEFITQARSEIKIYAQNISDYQILGLLAKAAQAGIHVEILLSTNPDKLYSKKFEYLHNAGVGLGILFMANVT